MVNDIKSKNSKRNSNGYSFIESAIVVGIVGIIAAGSFAISAQMKKRMAVDEARSGLVHALERAQNRAATGFGTNKHGVLIREKEVTAYEYNDANERIMGTGEEFSFPSSASTDQTETDIIFSRISAATNLPDESLTVTLYGSGGADGTEKTTIIYKNGRIVSQ